MIPIPHFQLLMILKVKGNSEIIVDHYPYYQNINTKIVEDSENFNYNKGGLQANGKISNVRALKTVGRVVTSDTLQIAYEWIINLLTGRYSGNYWFIHRAWLAKYHKGEYTISHDHIPASFSFVYFVSSPKGSSPLIFTDSGKRIKPEEGKVVIFPGDLKHEVPKNKCDGRITLAGNIFPSVEKMN